MPGLPLERAVCVQLLMATLVIIFTLRKKKAGNHLLLGVKQRELVDSIGKESRNPWKVVLKFL